MQHHAEHADLPVIQVVWAAVALVCTSMLASSLRGFGKEAAKETAVSLKETAATLKETVRETATTLKETVREATATMKESAVVSARLVAEPLNKAVVVLENCT
jgi:hypothetical protein